MSTQTSFAAALQAECGVETEQAADHFDAFCAWKDTPTIRYHEYCHACLAVLPGDRAAKVDSKFATKCRQNFLLTVGRADSTSCVFVVAFGLYDVDNSGLIDDYCAT